ncbi:MAG: hypothetical protein ABI638_15460 [Ignavibacteriota bacterium]
MNLYLKYFTFLAMLTLSAFLGCEKKAEAPDAKPETTVKSEQAPVEVPVVDTVKPEIKEPVIQIPDLVGKWTGKFDSRPTVLNITKQTDSTFSGKISISYREAINQDVSGTISPSKLKISMKDLLHSRYQGKYYGNLSEDGKTFSGTFTMDLDKSKLAFNLSKK